MAAIHEHVSASPAIMQGNKSPLRDANHQGHDPRSSPLSNSETSSTPFGFCHCGCGGKTTLATRTVRVAGRVKGQPNRFIQGHQCVSSPVEYLVDEETGCWVWQRYVMPNGYGKGKAADGSKQLAHRVLYERHRGPIPEGLHLDHLCRNRGCVNPDHLEPVTPGENIRRGDCAQLTKEQVAEIRHLVTLRPPGRAPSPYSDEQLAKRYGVANDAIRNIRIGESWT